MSDKFRVSNPGGMWLRSQPIVSEETKIVLLPNGHEVTKLSDSENPDWARIKTTFENIEREGVSKKSLMVSADETTGDGISALIAKTLSVIAHVSPHAHPNYIQAFRDGGPIFQQLGITTPRRMAHFLAQAFQETRQLEILRESMNYKAPRILEIFGVHHHSARVTPAEANALAHHEEALAERVYGLGNPAKAEELGNTQPGDGFKYRGNGILQMTGRGAHHKRGLANGLDFENQPELATLPEHALKPALQEWADGNLNHFADINDIRTITIRINGGLNGFEGRKAHFAHLFPLLQA